MLADRYERKRLNSPNDLVYRSDGSLYFTDPPFGLPKFHDHPRREPVSTGSRRPPPASRKLAEGFTCTEDGSTLFITAPAPRSGA